MAPADIATNATSQLTHDAKRRFDVPSKEYGLDAVVDVQDEAAPLSYTKLCRRLESTLQVTQTRGRLRT